MDIIDKDFLKEKIGYYKTLVTLCWSSSFVLGSGISWSFINLKTFKQIFISTGIIFEITLFLAIIFFDARIRKLLKELKNDKY